MMDAKPTIRTNDWRPGCTIPVGWVFECIILILLVSAVRDLSSNVAQIVKTIEQLEKREAVNQ